MKKQKEKQIKDFVRYWTEEKRGYERGEADKFWLDLLRRVCGVENAAEFIDFEVRVKGIDGSQIYMDGYNKREAHSQT